jgi:hypothetical protein
MEIEIGIQPNCSECALVVYSDKLSKKQREFFDKFFKEEGYVVKETTQGNLSIETGPNANPDGKEGLWSLRDKIETLSKHLKLFIYENKQYGLIRDESYDEMIEEGRL